MKKVQLLLGSFLVIVFATGCFSKTLECSIEEDGTDMNVEIKYDSSGEEIKKVTTIIESDMEGVFTEEELNEEKDTFCEDYMDLDVAECSVDVDGTVITMEVTVDYSELTEDEKAEMDLDDYNGYESDKKDAEDSGFTCK